MQRAFLLFILIFWVQQTRAQYAEKDFVHYTVNDGLSENYITAIIQDDRGYMWIGTDIGLNRFDGHSFKNFYQGAKTLPLLSSTISKLKSIGHQQLGIISRGGFQLLNTNDLSVTNYTIPDTTAFSLYRNAAWDAVGLPGKSYAVSTASGFYVFNAKGQLDFRHDAYKLSDIGHKRILYGREIFTLSDNTCIIFINGAGAAYYDVLKKRFFELSKEEKDLEIFYTVSFTNNIGWTTRHQLNPDEFIFIQWPNKNILYHNRSSGRTVVSPLLIPPIEFTYDSKILMINDSSFLVNGGYSGFYRFHFNRSNGQITANPEKFLPAHKIQCLYLDKERRLWAGTSKGLLQQKLSPPIIHSKLYKTLPADSITGGLSCAFRYKDKLYLGRFSLNKGLVIIDTLKKTEKQIDFYGKNTKWNEISSIQMYHPDTLWLGTNAGLLWFDTKTLHYGKVINEKNGTILPELNILTPVWKDGYAWLCGHLRGVISRYHPASRTFKFFTSKTNPALPFDRVKSITHDAYGDVWISGHSLARWNSQNELFDTLITVYDGPNKFEDDILTMVADSKGSLWIHNALNGLLEYRIKENRFTSYTMKDGLPSNVFSAFSPVINNQLWMAGHNQLTGFNTVTKKITVYDHQDGYPDDKPSSKYLDYDSHARRLNLFHEHTLASLPVPQLSPEENEKEIIIEELVVNNKDHLPYPSGVRLKHNQNNLSLRFTIINFESGNNYQFGYRLEEKDNWTELGEQRNINLTGLAPGHYTIWLRSQGKSGVQKINRFSFLISPPFWKTHVFLLGIGFLIGGILFFIYHRRIKQVREKANIDRLFYEAEMKALHAQMNPHFIFNSLNSIREMILTKENKAASHFLSKFAHLIRMTLDQSRQSFISLRNTMDYLTRYIEMEQIRNSHFTCRILADEELDPDETVLPPMLIQPFIENAIWHGAPGSQKSININIDFKRFPGSGEEENHLVCIIEDNGVGINQSLKVKNNSTDSHHSVGIQNVYDRIRLLNEKYHLGSRVRIEDKTDIAGYKGTGTVVTLQLPLEIKEE